MTTTIRAARYLTVATLAVLLAACSAATGDVSAPTAEPAPAATEVPTTAPEPEPTPEPTPEVIEATVGDLVTEDEAELLPEGQTAYPLEDGTLVVVGANDPLPEPVREHAAAAIESRIEFGAGPLDEFEESTGKKVVYVGYLEAIDGPNKWTVAATPRAVNPPVATKAEAIAIAEAHVGAQDNPDNWALIVVD